MEITRRHVIGWMVFAALFVTGQLILASQIPDSVACDALDAQGFTGCQVKARHVLPSGYLGCGRDGLGFEAVATNPAGQRVPMLVCCGLLFKGCTLRTPRGKGARP